MAVGFNADPNQTLADYLTTWLQAKQLRLEPTTFARYCDYVANDLIPAVGDVLLDDLGYAHLAGYVRTQLERGRGKVTVHQILVTLSSALGDAVRLAQLRQQVQLVYDALAGVRWIPTKSSTDWSKL